MASKTYKYHIKAIDFLYEESLKQFVSHEELHERMRQICDGNEDSWRNENIFKVNPNDDNLKHNILAVNERIRLAEMIFPKENADWGAKYHIPPLCEYLILTGFDILGQQRGWMTFLNWMDAKKKLEEREKIFATFPSNLTSLEFAKKAYLAYQEIYGVSNSFFNFFKQVISNEQRERFLNAIEIEIYDNYPEDLFSVSMGDETYKLKYLYKVRNDFTHSCAPSDHLDILWPNHLDKDGWFQKAKWHDRGKKTILLKFDLITGMN